MHASGVGAREEMNKGMSCFIGSPRFGSLAVQRVFILCWVSNKSLVGLGGDNTQGTVGYNNITING